MNRPRFILWGIIFLTLVALLVDFPEFHLKFQVGSFKVDQVLAGPDINLERFGIKIKKDLDLKMGLDLQGGTHLTLQADMNQIDPADRDNALESAKNIVERRVNLYGVSEALVQTAKVGNDYRVIVELPGVKDISAAKELVGKTALLEFREFKEASPSAQIFPTLETTNSTGLTGKDLKKAKADFSQDNSEPVVSFAMTSDGGKKFAELTTRLVGKPLAIFLDSEPITWPTVREPITGGEGIISGGFTTDQAKELAIQLNAGALPVPIKIIEERTIGPTLGRESLDKSFFAGAVGLSIVVIFMLAYYTLNGFLADLALVIYALVVLAAFKLIPITLTLAGIAGFILSVGMAVDANILIFERMKEEIRSGRAFKEAIEIGFSRAWPSIRDSNVSSLITCTILYWFGTGAVRGFALALALGIVFSMFTAISVTRTFLRFVYRQ